MLIKDYKQLEVWKKGLHLAVLVYSVTKTFPKDEKYGLISQMRRSSGSITANIAEGSRQFSRKSYLHYVRIAFGSASELEAHICLANALGFIPEKSQPALNECINHVLRMLNRLIQTLMTPLSAD